MPIAPDTRMGAVHLTVADLGRSRAFYEGAIGLRAHAEEGSTLRLGAPGGEELLVLHEEPGARPVRGGHAGLFHFALLLPERVNLARWLAHAVHTRIPLAGASEHFVSEALYLRDPDHHGIEIYRDRPREQWFDAGGALRMGTVPLDVDDLLGVLDEQPFEALPRRTTMGHVHLHVADIGEAVRFYEALGFEAMTLLADQAAFLSAGRYHHHVGANVWAGRGVGPPPPGSAALRHATILLPGVAERDRVAEAAGKAEEHEDGLLVGDPAGNRLVLAADRASTSPRELH